MKDEALEIIESWRLTLPEVADDDERGGAGVGIGVSAGGRLWGLGLKACDQSFERGEWDAWVGVAHR